MGETMSSSGPIQPSLVNSAKSQSAVSRKTTNSNRVTNSASQDLIKNAFNTFVSSTGTSEHQPLGLQPDDGSAEASLDSRIASLNEPVSFEDRLLIGVQLKGQDNPIDMLKEYKYNYTKRVAS